MTSEPSTTRRARTDVRPVTEIWASYFFDLSHSFGSSRNHPYPSALSRVIGLIGARSV